MIKPIEDDIEIYPNVVYYNTDHSKSKVCTSKISLAIHATYTLASSWQELITELEQGAKFLAFHADNLDSSTNFTPIELVEAITTVVKFMPKSHDLKIAVVVTPSTPLSVVRTLKKAGIQGLLLDLNYCTIEEVAVGVNALVNKLPYWPKHVIDKLLGNVRKEANIDKVTLTTRQTQVFRFVIERGASNKVIAKALGITESTVKLHMTEIFKKYGVKSRTQLVVFSTALT